MFCLVVILSMLTCLQISSSHGRILNPCEVADVMVKLGQKRTNVAKWVCLAKYSSGFNTQALSQPCKDGSFDFGIFQINDKFCKLGTKTSCGATCTDLVADDITQSAKCALKIFQKNGFKDWPAWKENCQEIDTSRFIVKCSLRSRRRKQPTRNYILSSVNNLSQLETEL